MTWDFAANIKKEFKEDLEDRRREAENNNDKLVEDITESLKYMGKRN